MSKTKIVVVKMKELIFTVVLVCLGILVLLLLMMFLFSKDDKHPADADKAEETALYHAGVYTSVLTLNDTALNLEVVCDANHINSVRLINLDESVTTMYPLLHPALEELELQLSNDVPLEELQLTESSKYTQTLLLEVIERTLEKAKTEQNSSSK